MSVLRIHKKQQNYIILDKTCLNDSSLSWGAKGLHAYLMSLPDDWRVRVNDLQKRSKNGRDAVRALLKELEQAGFIKKTRCRDNENGRFGGMEYLVLEIPESQNDTFSPATEKPFSVDFVNKIPSPENPCTGNPPPGNPTLINNKDNNYPEYKRINKTADITDEQREHSKEKQKAAAVFSFQRQEVIKNKTENNQFNKTIQVLSQEDAVIGQVLTKNQLSRIQHLVAKLNIEHKAVLLEEIQYCLLSKAHFSGCGEDFSKKLNAIRTVIVRGDWQTPAGIVLEIQKKSTSHKQKLEQELRDAQAEAIHFQRLLLSAKDPTRAGLEDIVKKVQLKITELEKVICKAVANSQLALS